MNNENGKFDKGRYTTIPETKNIKLPIGGKIRLGIRVKNEQGKEYPKEVDHFVCTKEVRDVFGDEPTELTVFFPVADREKVFPQCYEKYGSNEALLCQGDGEKSAQRLNLENGSWKNVKCPCEHYGPYNKKTKIGGCVKAGYLKFMIPSVSIGTFYQCRVGGTVSIEECNSAFELADKTTGGCWAMIPFRMKRIPKKLKIPGTANMKTHWVVTLEIAASTEEIRRVISGEILYLGQQKDRQFELETPELPLANQRMDTEEESIAREEKAKKSKEAEEEFWKQSKINEAQTKKDREEGKEKIKSYKESKAIYKKKVEEENKILLAISEKAKETGIATFEKLVKFALDQGIFKTMLTENIARKVLTTNKDVYDQLMKALEPPTEGNKEKLDKMFETLQEAGLSGWKEIAYFACLADLIEPGTAVEDVKMILLKDSEAVGKIMKAAKIEKEEDDQEIADEDIPDRVGKLEVKNEDAPYPDEKISDEDIPD